jgi:hypothetical protein
LFLLSNLSHQNRECFEPYDFVTINEKQWNALQKWFFCFLSSLSLFSHFSSLRYGGGPAIPKTVISVCSGARKELKVEYHFLRIDLVRTTGNEVVWFSSFFYKNKKQFVKKGREENNNNRRKRRDRGKEENNIFILLFLFYFILFYFIFIFIFILFLFLFYFIFIFIFILFLFYFYFIFIILFILFFKRNVYHYHEQHQYLNFLLEQQIYMN